VVRRRQRRQEFATIVRAVAEGRNETSSVLTMATFDNRTLHLVAGAEVVLAILIAEGVFLPTLLGTTQLTGDQWLMGATPALVPVIGWELEKLVARRRSGHPTIA
jgi:hypothetical protein